MRTEDLIRVMRAAGAKDAVIFKALAILNDERLAKGRAKTAKYRKNNNNRDQCDVTIPNQLELNGNRDQCDVTPRARVDDSSSSVEKTGKKEGASKAKRGTRLSPDWEPSSADEAFAIGRGMTREIVVRTAFKFKNYWLTKPRDATKLDWSRTWQNWVVTELERVATPAKPVRKDPYGRIIN